VAARISALSLLLLVALAGCGGGGGDSTGTQTQARHDLTRQTDAACRKGESPAPGRLFQGQQKVAGGFIATQDLWPLKSQWQAGDCKQFTAVDAGAYAAHRADGLFGIVRIPARPSSQEQKLIKVPGAGALTITRAPLGPKVETWAQKRGKIQFTSKNGVTGTLHLENDTVTTNGPGVKHRFSELRPHHRRAQTSLPKSKELCFTPGALTVDAGESFSGIAPGHPFPGREQIIKTAVHGALIPTVRAEMRAVRRSTGGARARQVERVGDAARHGINEVTRNPNLLVRGDIPGFKRAQSLAERYGLAGCSA
jgi:hypothetical protein